MTTETTDTELLEAISAGMRTLRESAAARIAQILLEDDEEDAAHALIRLHGESTHFAREDSVEMEFPAADSAREAAEEFVSGGDYKSAETCWVSVWAWRRWSLGDLSYDEEESDYDIAADPDEPECSEGSHDWVAPYDVVGGCRENPGVWGHGGGVVYHEVCAHCGALKTIDTWAQNPENGVQGLTSVRYRAPGEHEYSDSFASWKGESDE